MAVSGDRLFNGRVLLEHAVQEIRGETSLDPGEAALVIAAAGDLLEALKTMSERLDVRPVELPDLSAVHAWSLRVLDKANRRRGRLPWPLR